MAELPWLAAGAYVPLLFFWSQDGLFRPVHGGPRKIRAAAGADAHLRGIAAVGTKAIFDRQGSRPRVLWMSGKRMVPEGGRFLAKPYSPNALADMLRELIDARQN
jgi:hypothetical protein